MNENKIEYIVWKIKSVASAKTTKHNKRCFGADYKNEAGLTKSFLRLRQMNFMNVLRNTIFKAMVFIWASLGICKNVCLNIIV